MKYDLQIKLELETAKKIWPDSVQTLESEQLESLVRKYRFSVKRGDLQILNRRWYVTHTGLVGLAYRGASLRPPDVQNICGQNENECMHPLWKTRI